MADRTSARVFAEIFIHLAEQPDDRNKELAAWLWDVPMRKRDFDPAQMGCLKALALLGLARRLEGPEDSEDPDDWIYRH